MTEEGNDCYVKDFLAGSIALVKDTVTFNLHTSYIVGNETVKTVIFQL